MTAMKKWKYTIEKSVLMVSTPLWGSLARRPRLKFCHCWPLWGRTKCNRGIRGHWNVGSWILYEWGGIGSTWREIKFVLRWPGRRILLGEYGMFMATRFGRVNKKGYLLKEYFRNCVTRSIGPQKEKDRMRKCCNKFFYRQPPVPTCIS